MVKNLPAMQKTHVQTLGQEDPLEKAMATTPVFLPGEFHGQRSLELQRVGHDCATNTHTHYSDTLQTPRFREGLQRLAPSLHPGTSLTH